MTRLGELPTEIKSKNAGPFRVTFDIVFEDPDDYREARESELVTEDRVVDVFGVSPDEIVGIHYYDPARAIKITLLRPIPSGHPADPDVNGSQQYVPLLSLEL